MRSEDVQVLAAVQRAISQVGGVLLSTEAADAFAWVAVVTARPYLRADTAEELAGLLSGGDPETATTLRNVAAHMREEISRGQPPA